MTKRFVADDASMLTLHRRLWELARRVIEGSLDVHEVNRALQSLIDGGPNTSAVQLSPAHSRLVQAAAKRFGVRPAEAKRMLGPVPYSAEVLAECAETHVLVPYLGLSLAEVHGLHARLLFDKIAGPGTESPIMLLLLSSTSPAGTWCKRPSLRVRSTGHGPSKRHWCRTVEAAW